jgi:hypothetical protein
MVRIAVDAACAMINVTCTKKRPSKWRQGVCVTQRELNSNQIMIDLQKIKQLSDIV